VRISRCHNNFGNIDFLYDGVGVWAPVGARLVLHRLYHLRVGAAAALRWSALKWRMRAREQILELA